MKPFENVYNVTGCRRKSKFPRNLSGSLGSLSNHDDDGNKKPTNLHIWQWKKVFLHALHVHFSSFDIFKTFSLFLRREMACFAVVWTTWADDDKCSILSYVPSAGSKFNSRIVRTQFSSIMTLNNLEMIAETRSYIFRWGSHFRPSTSCLLKFPFVW